MSGSQKTRTAVARAKVRHRKVPGFDAYNAHPHPDEVTKFIKGKGKKNKKKKVKNLMLPCEEIVEPETGIHSYEWASKIVEQDCGFCRLPYEVRLKIYKLVIADMAIGKIINPNDFANPMEAFKAVKFWSTFYTANNRIAPYKDGKKFWSPGWFTSDTDTHRLLLICRQSYVDVAGGALFYSFNTFCFSSTNLMLNYLLVIKPFHMNSITSIELHFKFSNQKKSLDTKAFEALAECKGLQNLTIRITVMHDILEITPPSYVPGTWLPQAVYHYHIPANCLAKVRDFKPLRALSGLTSFNIQFDCITSRDWNTTTWSHHSYAPAPDAQDKYRSIEEELRLVIVKDYKGKDTI